ncbi:cytoplasmic dynein 2 intermediate chain 1-like isoform X3 [Ostrea edulis]|uniref:cytoplasmic dynein 2 intermediate chain 1-like isoform X3 n=1 Tax=Ostrea edulis TaxID=37623 RepID=UPI0024AF15E2|nr:cytoplasmic dynein 2 intermediate chain 1-like isoform X3 [Ostrea edulis]
MPSEKIRSKEDTWSTNELKRALNKDEIRKERERLRRERKEGKEDINDYDEKDRRHRKDGDERRRHRDDEDRRKHRESKKEEITEDDREAQRRERREKREGKSSKPDDKRRDEDRRRHRDEEDDNRRERRHRDRDDERHRDRDDRDRDEERERRRKERDAEKEKRHRDKDGRHRDKEEKSDDRRRRHKDEDGEDRRRRHREDDDDRKSRHRRDEEDEDKKRRHHRDEDERERRKDRHKDDADGHKKRKHRQKEREEETTLDEDEREKQRQERREKRESKEGGKSRHRDEDDEERRRRKEKEREKEREREREKEKAKEAEEENGYDDYEEDFEDYEDDFEDEEEEAPAAKGKLSDYEFQKSPRKVRQGLDYSDSEMDEVLKALDQENDRLYHDSRQKQDSPREEVREKRYNRYNNQSDDQDSDSEPTRPVTRGIINFSGAKQRAISRKANSKTAKRAQDLLQMIELDVSAYDLFDLPPVKEYDLYIRSFGRTDTKQAYVQTNEDNIDRDIQTDEIDFRQKWTQHPPEDFTGCGRGDGEKDLDEEETAQQNKQQDLGRLNSFIQKAGQVISILMDEEKDQQRNEKAENRTNLALSEGYSQLTCLSILKGRCIEFAHFSPTQPNYLLTVFSKSSEVSESNPVDRKGIICMWNTNEPSYPQRILACESQPLCCCFSPYKTSLVFAGMVDGSVCAWDLREPPALHKSIQFENSDHLLRYPTYNTAGIVEVDNHHSPLTTLSPVVSYTDSESDTQESHDDSTGGLSFQLISCEELGVLKFWVVAEISSPDMAGSEVDLGLSPGGRIKLVLSSSIKLQNPKGEKSGPLRSFELQLSPGDLNHYYVGTEKGFVYHGLRFGSRAYPRKFTALNDAPVDIKTIDFSPFCHPCFLVSTGDGDVHLFSSKTDTALVSWPARVWGTRGVKCAKWSQSRPCVFYVLDDNSRLYTFDLLEGDSMPAKIETLSNEARVTYIAFTSDVRQSGHGGRNPQMLICLESGVAQIHTIAKEYREQQTLENDFLPTYLARF